MSFEESGGMCNGRCDSSNETEPERSSPTPPGWVQVQLKQHLIRCEMVLLFVSLCSVWVICLYWSQEAWEILLGGTLGMVIWWAIVRFLFKKKVGCKLSSGLGRRKAEDQLWKEKEYHNLTIYKALEFYIKILIALLTGLAVLAAKQGSIFPKAIPLMKAGGILVGLVSFLFCVLLISHQSSKIQRWSNWDVGLFQWLWWSETWMFTAAIMIIFGVYWLLNQLIIPAEALLRVLIVSSRFFA